MRTIILRSLLLATVCLVVFQDVNAQRSRSSNRYRGYNYYPSRSRTIINFTAPRVMIPFGGYNYYYSSGYYYRPYRNYYRSVLPPIGIRINILPRGYRSIYAGDVPYYYYGGTYYRRSAKDAKDYEVVDAPLGASIPELPEGAKAVVINEQKYYELDGTYYKEDIRDNSEIWYTVVGKDGKLNTNETIEPVDEGPAVGDVVDSLPDNCRTVVVSGNKYYVSPDDIYYEEVMERNTVKYKIVGK